MNYYLIGVLVGAGAGYALSKKDREKWALIGAGAGVAAGYIATKFEEPAVTDGEYLVEPEIIVDPATGAPIVEATQPYAGYSTQAYNASASTPVSTAKLAPVLSLKTASRSIAGLKLNTTPAASGTSSGGARSVGGGARVIGTGTGTGTGRRVWGKLL
jgi:hypothetical protein